jgi:soluble lytic murein transglycosylase-like protein
MLRNSIAFATGPGLEPVPMASHAVAWARQVHENAAVSSHPARAFAFDREGRGIAATRGLAPWILAVSAAIVPALCSSQEAANSAEQIANLRRAASAFEHGDGVPRDGPHAASLYCEAARLGDASSAFDIGWMYANGRGVTRDDGLAASFFRIAAIRGVEQASNMLRILGDPPAALPDCMADPTPAQPEAAPEPLSAATPPIALRAPKQIVELVNKIASEYRVPVPLVIAIIQAESNYDAVAISPKNAQGLMQLVPETALRFRVKNVFDPVQNVRGGVAYLRWLLAYFEGEVSLVAAAYNAGERSVERYGGVPPYEETRAYVRRILAHVGAVPQPYDASIADPSPLMRHLRERQAAK